MKKTAFTVISSFLIAGSLLAGEDTIEQLKSELNVSSGAVQEDKACHLYIVHHGDTDWTATEKLQGWIDIPLNDEGKKQMQEISLQLAGLDIAAIYTSDLLRAVESAKIIGEKHESFIHLEKALRGETHGKLEGKDKVDYKTDPHFLHYKSLTAEEKIFFSVGEEGESKADVARRVIPAIRKICQKHPGQNVVIVTHGGALKFINFLLGNFALNKVVDIEHGQYLRVDGDGEAFKLVN